MHPSHVPISGPALARPLPDETMGGREEDLPFRIELWDDADRHIEEVIALASDFASACGAYEEAVKRRPGKLITLRQKAPVIKKSS